MSGKSGFGSSLTGTLEENSMEKEKNSPKKTHTKANVDSTSKNIQPRVVLQRLTKDYTVGASTSSDDQPSTCANSSQNQNEVEVHPEVLFVSGEKQLKTEENDQVNPASKKRRIGLNKEVIEFKVAKLKEISSRRSVQEEDSDCSYHSSPEEVVVINDDEGKVFREENKQIRSQEEVSPETSTGEENITTEGTDIPEGTNNAGEVNTNERNNETEEQDDVNVPEDNYRAMFARARSRAQKATFLALLISIYARHSENSSTTTADTDINQPSTSGQNTNAHHRRTVVPRPQRNNLRDCMVRVWLSVCGQRRKKKFQVKLSQLLSLLKNRNHPLHRFRNTLTLQNLNYLKHDEITAMARVLSEFVCAQPVDLKKSE